jgi:transposase-like protein
MKNETPILIELSDFNLEKISIVVAKELIKAKPGLTRVEYAKKLGVCERTFYRWISKYKLNVQRNTPGKKARSIDTMIKTLEKSGYEVKKK